MSDDNDKTVFRPSPSPPQGGPPARPAAAAPADRTIIGPSPAAPPPPAAEQRTAAGVQVGDVLNHIFEVRRFLARGGMGEVFEGVNVNSDERVAIKVILPALAADPAIIAMFRKEAQTLTRLSHPALVQYRVLAQEPRLGIFYIVTEYIDGANLADLLDTLKPSADELIALARRLAEGLGAAHELGAVHRDISPDNVLLQDGKLSRARIIDFGIAKDTQPGSQTIVGDGFAGKLGYVAPEQLGDFSRKVGPWTDVYSLGLLLVAVAQGRGTDLGGSFVDAINKRRAGIDTGSVPAELRPVVDKMLVADPDQRLQSMQDVLGELGGIRAGHAQDRRRPQAPAKPDGGAAFALPKVSKPVAIGAGAAAALVFAGLLGWIAFGGSDGPAPPEPTATPAARAVSIADVRQAIQAELPGVPCTWLSLVSANQTPAGAELAFTGVASRPSDAEASIFRTVQARGATVAVSDFAGVAPISPAFCTVLDSLRPIRLPDPSRLSLSSSKYEISPFTDGEYVGKLGARVILDLALDGLAGDFALYGIEETGEISEITGSRAVFMQAVGSGIERLPGPEHYRLSIDGPRGTGWSGFLLLSGSGGFERALLQDYRTAGWSARFDQAARANGWQAQMVWFKFVDEVPN